jgi:hypothetical protein
MDIEELEKNRFSRAPKQTNNGSRAPANTIQSNKSSAHKSNYQDDDIDDDE